MSFANFALHPLILKSLAEDGYVEATPVQAAAIPPALEGRDVLATAATGTGKTAAFLLPSLSRIATTAKKCPAGAPRILVLAPTRELAAQVTQAARKYGRFLKLDSAEIVGGAPYRQQLRQLSRPIDVIVATPGRLIDHLQRGRLDLAQVEVLILDEADRMLDMGFAEEVDRIASVCSADRQTLLFTATMDKRMTGLAGRLLKNPVRVAVDHESTAPAIEQRVYHADHLDHKRRLLQHFAASTELAKAIVFVATKRDCDTLARELTDAGHRAAPLHGDLDQSQRNHAMHRLRTGDLRILVATDVAARGIDVRDISHVINFDLPRAAGDYVHRIGRTGRAGAAGIAISLAGPADRGILQNIAHFTRAPLTVHVVPGMEPTRSAHRAPHRAPHHAPGGRPSAWAGRPASRPGNRPGYAPAGKPAAGKPHFAGRRTDKPGAGKPGAGKSSWAARGARPR